MTAQLTVDTTAMRAAEPATPRGPKDKIWLLRAPYLILFAVMAILVVVPMVVLLVASFTDSAPRPGDAIGNFTLDNYAAIFSARGLSAAGNSAIIAFFAGSLAMILGTAMAWLAARSDVPGRSIVSIAGIIPLFISAFVGAMAWSLIASPQAGYINLFFDWIGWDVTLNVYSLPGIIFVQAIYYSPYAFIFVFGALRLMNPEMEEAALIHGARQRHVVRFVTLPIIRPALLGAAVLTFALVLEDFPIQTILGAGGGIETLPTMVYSLMTVAPSQMNQASALGMTLLVILVAIIVFQRMLLKNKSYTTVSGKGFKPSVVKLGKWRWPAFGLVALYLIIAVVLPILALAKAAFSGALYVESFTDIFDPSTFSTDVFVDTVTSGAFLDALNNSFVAGIAAAIFGVILYVALAYFIQRTQMKGRRLLEQLATAPVAIPALIMGLAFFWTWAVVPLPVYGTLIILVLAYIARLIPQGYGGISGTMQQIDGDLEAAAKVAGAGNLRALTYVTLPLLRTSIISAGLLVLILSLRELSSSIFLYTSQTRVLSVLVFGQWENGQWDKVAAMSLAYSAILLVITIIGGKWLKPA
ncbi:iron ABC transporter permease [Salinibacterium sp. dk2585]|uniref:ABC transporter permease n=1 Tax=unclassified Salinibacterium TaxID=2632331 RepID=UPI0011C24B48|nr:MULTISPECIES: iron ABC transporter permease [unclassified Salinibacterium]QEE60436.1 iron ABC transporter permease [Salinibacterium sp. dk2585]TXK55509.1 iron ABC transporter permease [Salinibacterium sp. dk5596]